MTATGLAEKDNSIKSITFLHVVGPESLEINNTFTWETAGDDKKLDKIMEKGSVMVSVCKCLWFLEKIKVSQLFFNVQFTLSGSSIL